jgi:hypothetical protein
MTPRWILSFLGREHLSGRQQHIKEYEVVVTALGRDTSFDLTKDSIVTQLSGEAESNYGEVFGRE